MGEFRAIGLEKFLAGREVAEQAAHFNTGSTGTTVFMDSMQNSVTDISPGSGGGFPWARENRHPGHRADTGQCLTPEPQGGNGCQLTFLGEL